MRKKLLDKITSPKMLKAVSFRQLDIICKELREEIIDTVSKNGGHLSPNLGTVELTTALVRCFDLPKDKIVFDVGHQCYTYKLLTKRRDKFHTIRQKDGISGYPKKSESKYDSFVSGHSSTSIAVAQGIEKALAVKGKDGYVVAVIGDGAMTGGLAFEALNNIDKNNSKLIIILNDNDMSINKSEGAFSRYLNALRTNRAYFKTKDVVNSTLKNIPYIGDSLRDTVADVKHGMKQAIYPTNFFEQFGFYYMGPVDGHNVKSLCEVINEAKSKSEPIVIHVKTVKGKGYAPAEKNPDKYHGVSPFKKEIGLVDSNKKDFSSEFGEILLEKARKDSNIVAITAAMESSTGLTAFANEFKSKGRFFDVGIAESYATAYGAALCSGGTKAVFAVYSSFLQRAYDQLIHDCSIEAQNLVLAIDRAGIVGSDGETHQGIFDVSMLSSIPKTTIYAPIDYKELETMLDKALYKKHSGIVAVRYPRGGELLISEEIKNISTDNGDFSYIKGEKNLIITYGRMYKEAIKVYEKTGCGVMRLQKIHPLSIDTLDIIKLYDRVIFVEEGIRHGGIGSNVAVMLMENSYKGEYKLLAIDDFVPQGEVSEMLSEIGLDEEGILKLMGEV